MGLLADVRAEHPLRAWGAPANAFVRVFNAFDSRFFNGFVFPSSGQPDYSRFAVTDQGAMRDPTRFYEPRRIEVGVTLHPGNP